MHVVKVHKCIFDLIYGKPLELPSSMCPDEKIHFLAELVYFARLYDILGISSPKIETAFVEIEGLEKGYHNNAVFFLEI
jgi:hypothetical protein